MTFRIGSKPLNALPVGADRSDFVVVKRIKDPGIIEEYENYFIAIISALGTLIGVALGAYLGRCRETSINSKENLNSQNPMTTLKKNKNRWK